MTHKLLLSLMCPLSMGINGCNPTFRPICTVILLLSQIHYYVGVSKKCLFENLWTKKAKQLNFRNQQFNLVLNLFEFIFYFYMEKTTMQK